MHLSGNDIGIVEICDNALDDDADGLIDLNDPDCACNIVEPVSLIPNPSFEDFNCCPVRQSQLDCATGWIQASEPTTDFIHMCDWMGWPEFPPPLPFPDGEGIMGFRDGRVRQENSGPEYNWKEYAGACLLSPLKAGTSYVFEFYVGFVNASLSPDINISFFGTPDCAHLPFGVGDETFGCPTNGPDWIRLGSRMVSGGGRHTWVKTSIQITPQEDIAAIAIGPDCPEVESPISIYYFFDNLTLVDLATFEFRISEMSHPCMPDFTLKIPDLNGSTYQWYKNGIALPGETSPQLHQIYGEGAYQVKVLKEGSCALTGIYTYTIPVITEQIEQTICEEDVYQFGERVIHDPGQYIDTFKSIHNCDSIVILDLHKLAVSEDTVHVKIFSGETYRVDHYHFTNEGDYPLRLNSSLDCDSLVLLKLTYYHVFIPNVFSPNGDGINDFFNITSKEGEMDKVDITIFDRWGNQIYSGPQWDGSNNGVILNPGAYAYIATLKMSDGLDRKITGMLTMVR